MDVFQQARELGFSPGNAEKQIIHARRLCGEKKYHGGRSKLENEISDSEEVTGRVKGVDDKPVEISKSNGTLPSVNSFRDAEKGTKSSNHKNTHSVIDDQADVATLPPKKKRRRSSSSAGKAPAFSETEKSLDPKQMSDDQGPSAKIESQQSKSDEVNGDPSELFEVPDDVKEYLEMQAIRKRAKKDKKRSTSDDKHSSASTLNNGPGDERNKFPTGHRLGDIQYRDVKSRESQTTDIEKTTKDGRPEKEAHKTEHQRETGSPLPSADHGLIQRNGPRKELTIEEKAARKARRKERRQLAKANLESGPNDAGQEPRHSSINGKSTEKAQNESFDEIHDLVIAKPAGDRPEKMESLDQVRGEATPQSEKRKKKKKKKNKLKNGSVSKESGFQSPMIQ